MTSYVSAAPELLAQCGNAKLSFFIPALAYFQLGFNFDWQPLEATLSLGGGANAAFAPQLWTGNGGTKGFIISNNQNPSNTFGSSFDGDAAWNYCNGNFDDYAGTVHFTSSDAGATLPATSGQVTITRTDTKNAALTATVTVNIATTGSVTSPAVDCLHILKASASGGDGIYWIDSRPQPAGQWKLRLTTSTGPWPSSNDCGRHSDSAMRFMTPSCFCTLPETPRKYSLFPTTTWRSKT